MKLTLANIKELKRNSNSPLLKRVCNYVIDRWSEYDDKKHIFTDVLNYGCQSGVVGELIYCSATSGTKKIRWRSTTTIKTFWRGSVSKKRSETSVTTLKNSKITFKEKRL